MKKCIALFVLAPLLFPSVEARAEDIGQEIMKDIADDFRDHPQATQSGRDAEPASGEAAKPGKATGRDNRAHKKGN